MTKQIEVIFRENVDTVKLKKQYQATEEEQKEQYNPFDLEDLCSYNPLYSKLFPEYSKSFTNCKLNHTYHISDLHGVTDNQQKKTKKNIFIKYSPLVDPVHYLIGKYKENFTVSRHIIPYDQTCKDATQRILDPNNCAYVDGFFNFLSSKLLHECNFCHGVDYYGSYVCNQKKFKIDIGDDFDYLQDSRHFMDTYKSLYNINHDILQNTQNHRDGTYSHKPRIQISDTMLEINDCVDIIEDIPYMENNKDEMEMVFQDNDASVKKKAKLSNIDSDSDSDSDSDDSSNNSVISTTTDEDDNSDEENDTNSQENEDDMDDDSGDSDDSNDSSSETDYDHIYAYIYNYPVHMICMEKCDGTFDDLLENKQLNEKGINSALVQIIFMLITYQKVFDFTHNDLHTNNIVYSTTNIKYIHYVYNHQTYIVPTFGKIYKLIDFGRSIYRFENHLMYSDSFSKGNDANSQYNSFPYVNDKKPIIHPNKSFDLCRLGCSLYDFLFDEEDESEVGKDNKKKKKQTESQKTVERWCTEDSGKNILYKTSGDERYPNFKLYKMIARNVHNHVPENQLQYYLCTQYLQQKQKSKHSNSFSHINIDKLPKMYVNEP